MGLEVTEITLSRLRGESSRSLSGRKAKRYFQVKYEATTPPASLAAVETANDGTTAIPTLQASTLPGDSSRYVDEVIARPINPDGLQFEVEVSYINDIVVFDNPLSEPDKIEWGGAEGTEPYFIDQDDPQKPVVNTAGQPFEMFLERDKSSLTVTVTRNLASFPGATAFAYIDTVNSADITVDGVTIPAGSAKMGLISCGPEQVRNGTTYREVKYPMKLRPTWDDVIDSYGLQEKVSGKLRPIVDGTNLPVSKPWPLNEDGTKKTNPDDAAFQITFRPFVRASFAGFSFA
jgi:hypothetical protein